MANALLGLGLRRGDRLMYRGPMSLREVDVFFATQKIGVVFVPFKDSLSQAEAEAQVRYIRPALVVGDGLPGMDDVAIIGLPDPTWGEVVCAAMVLHAGAQLPVVEAVRSICPAASLRTSTRAG